MRRIFKNIFLSLPIIGLIGVSSCKKKEEVPIEPVIKYSNFVITGDSAKLYFTFTDGDGDIGLAKSDTGFDFFIKYFELQNGNWKEIVLPAPFNYRMPVINKSGKKKALQGEVIIDITPTYYNPFSNFDTLRYEFYIKDKALHESNHETTPDYAIIAPQ